MSLRSVGRLAAAWILVLVVLPASLSLLVPSAVDPIGTAAAHHRDSGHAVAEYVVAGPASVDAGGDRRVGGALFDISCPGDCHDVVIKTCNYGSFGDCRHPHGVRACLYDQHGTRTRCVDAAYKILTVPASTERILVDVPDPFPSRAQLSGQMSIHVADDDPAHTVRLSDECDLFLDRAATPLGDRCLAL